MLLLNVRGWGQTVIMPNNLNSGKYEITQNETWDYDTSYVVTCDIIVKNGAAFTIIPVIGTNKGISIYLYPDVKVQIDNGKFNATGESTRKIKFTSAINFSSLMWKGIQFNATPNNLHSKIDYCIIEYVEKGDAAPCGPDVNYDGSIFLYDFDNITISNCTIRNNQVSKRGGGIFIGSSGSTSYTPNPGYPLIINNEIYNNSAERGGGICVFSILPWSTNSNHAYASIQNNIIQNNDATEGGGGIAIMSYSNAGITNNTISNNTAHCLNSVFPVSGGGGIVVGQNSFARISYNTIDGNTSLYNSSNIMSGLGGGILVRIGSEVDINHNSIFYNTSVNGSGIAIVNGIKNGDGGSSFANMMANQIHENFASNLGGGIYILRSFCEASENEVYNNEAHHGGGLTISSTFDYTGQLETHHATFENNKFYFNRANLGAGIYIQSEFEYNFNFQNYLETNLDFFNNLLHHNRSESDGAAVYLNSNINLNFNNNTIVDNYSSSPILQKGDGIFISSGSFNNTLSLVNNLIYDNGLSPSYCQIYHPNNIVGEFQNNNIMNLGCGIEPDNNYHYEPLFINPSIYQYQLQQGSPLIDLGWNSVIQAIVDLDFNPRIINSNIDIGAYEFDGPPARKAKPLDSILDSKLSIYPNPVKDFVVISSNGLIYSVELSNMDGKILYFSENILNSYYTLGVSSLKPGVYFVRIYHDNSIETIKLIKE
jgi:hypothetical protein